MDETMKIIAKKQMAGFSMRQVTDAAGTSEALLYKHFESREKLLFECYQSVDREIAKIFDMDCLPDDMVSLFAEKAGVQTGAGEENAEQGKAAKIDERVMLEKKIQLTESFFKYLWMKYISFLVANGYKTLFYFEYRDSYYFDKVKECLDYAKGSYFKTYNDMYETMCRMFGMSTEVVEFFCTYIIDIASLFARRIIRGDIDMIVKSGDEAGYEKLWNLVYGGIAGLLWQERCVNDR